MPNRPIRTILFVIVFIFFPSFLMADPIYYGSYNPTAPIGTRVALRSGEVSVKIFLDEGPKSPIFVARFDCIFRLFNTGREEKMLVGFPIPLHPEHFNLALPENIDLLLLDSELPVFSLGAFDFKVTADNIPLKVITYTEATTNLTMWPIPTPYDEIPSYSRHFGWRFWKMDMGKKEAKELKVSYTMRFFGKQLSYIVDTGASWKGLIENFFIQLNPGPLKDGDFETIEPTGYRVEDGNITWRFRNFEPTTRHNLHLIVKDETYKRLTAPPPKKDEKSP